MMDPAEFQLLRDTLVEPAIFQPRFGNRKLQFEATVFPDDRWEEVSLIEWTFSGCTFESPTFESVEFQRVRFERSSLLGARFVRCRFVGCQFLGNTDQGAEFLECTFEQGELSEWNHLPTRQEKMEFGLWTDNLLKGVSIHDCTFNEESPDWVRCTLRSCRLENISFLIPLKNCRLEACSLLQVGNPASPGLELVDCQWQGIRDEANAHRIVATRIDLGSARLYAASIEDSHVRGDSSDTALFQCTTARNTDIAGASVRLLEGDSTRIDSPQDVYLGSRGTLFQNLRLANGKPDRLMFDQSQFVESSFEGLVAQSTHFYGTQFLQCRFSDFQITDEIRIPPDMDPQFEDCSFEGLRRSPSAPIHQGFGLPDRTDTLPWESAPGIPLADNRWPPT